MRNFHFFDTNEKPELHVGLRIIKTVIAVYICAIIGYLRGGVSIVFSMITVIICMQSTKDKSLLFAFNRIIGTIIGGALGAICLFFSQLSGVINNLPFYYLIIALMLIPLMEITLLIRKPSTTAFSCIVFLSVTVMRIGDASALEYAANRTLETLIGIVVALLVNWIIPKSKHEHSSDSVMSAAGPVPEARGSGGTTTPEASGEAHGGAAGQPPIDAGQGPDYEEEQ
ncbi:MAG TPA: hypothetical protein DD735_09925 [Clostridiales bacterium]|nr:hypothetical protein [Clostridiales bacterium]